jgi:carotenoid cleavage dioxygenase
VSNSIPIPWVQWQRFRIQGVVREKGSLRPLPGLIVRVFDRDLVLDDHLGDAITNADGVFELDFTDADFKDVVETRPDLYLRIFHASGGDAIHDTSHAIRRDASRDEYFEIEIPRDALRETE